MAGCTGSGKSTCLNQIIINTILTQTPTDNKQPKILLNLIDLKSGIEFVHYKKCSIVNSYATDIQPAAEIILKLEKVAIQREKLFSNSGISKIDDYNSRYPYKQLPYHLVIVDEFADLRGQKEITAVFDKVLRKGRSSGIFFILSTQRPTVDTIPGNFKANIQCYLAFRTTSARESEIILGYGNQDAVKLNIPGRGILQTYDRVEVQPMYIKNDDRIINPMIKHTFRKEININKINMSGVMKC
jgi:S-DNA-T family DNA segregation ATPase FtsK/SpoIIIE